MSKTTTPGVEAVNHQEQAAYVAISQSHGSDRRLHKVQGDPDAGELRNGEECEVACSTTLTSDDSTWKAKPAAVFPVGYHPVCTDPECFGEDDVDGQ
jgi:hypothetical protein